MRAVTMVCHSILRLCSWMLLAGNAGIAEQAGAISGRVVDRTGVHLQFPTVRLEGLSKGAGRLETNGDADGQFRFAIVTPGIYSLKIMVPGFTERAVPNVRIAQGQQLNLGILQLELPGCVPPNVCDDFGMKVYDDPIHAQGSIEVPDLCAVDIDEGKVICSVELDGRKTIPPIRNPDDDFWIKTGMNGNVYLKLRNGTSVALNPPTEWSKFGCIIASFSTKEVRIDGLRLGSRVCIRTNRDRIAQVTFDRPIKPREANFKLHFVTWMGRPDAPSLQNRPPQ